MCPASASAAAIDPTTYIPIVATTHPRFDDDYAHLLPVCWLRGRRRCACVCAYRPWRERILPDLDASSSSQPELPGKMGLFPSNTASMPLFKSINLIISLVATAFIDSQRSSEMLLRCNSGWARMTEGFSRRRRRRQTDRQTLVVGEQRRGEWWMGIRGRERERRTHTHEVGRPSGLFSEVFPRFGSVVL